MGVAAVPILIATTVAAAGVSAYGAVQQGRAQQYAAEFEAKQAENNAKIAEYQAQDAARRGDEEAQNVQRAYAQRIAAGRLGFASGNVLLDNGSAGLWQTGTEVSREADLAQVRTNTAMDIWGLKTQGQNYISQAGMSRAAGRNARTGAGLSAAGSLLGAAGTSAGLYFSAPTRFGGAGG